MVVLKTKKEIGYMHEAGKLLAACHKEIAKIIKPGITTMEIDRFVEDFLDKHGATAEQKGYRGYPYATCASVNDVICHGFPDKNPLNTGDIVKIDMVVNLNGWLADSAWSYAVGQISTEADKLMSVTKEALYKGIEKAVIGNRIGDISQAVQSHVEKNGFSVVRDLVGHGIGKNIHEDPEVPHFVSIRKGMRIAEGMVFTIEPMINEGTWKCRYDDNEWGVRTADGRLSAQYEHTIAITKDGPIILTEQCG